MYQLIPGWHRPVNLPKVCLTPVLDVWMNRSMVLFVWVGLGSVRVQLVWLTDRRIGGIVCYYQFFVIKN